MTAPVFLQRPNFPLHQEKPDPKSVAHTAKLKGAAQQFEGLLLQQVLKALFQSAPSMSGPTASMYQQMFEGPLAEQIARAGGIGLGPMLERAMGGEVPKVMPRAGAGVPDVPPPAQHVPLSANVPSGPRSAADVPADTGALTRIQASVSELLDAGGHKWAKAGALTQADLLTDPAAPGGSLADRSVRDAHGYQGYYKCNLFALEVARRAGFEVPTVTNGAHVAYPLSNDITKDAADGKLDNAWASVVTGKSSEDLEHTLASGERALLLSGQGQDGRHGHMAVLEHVRSVQYGPQGEVQQVVFDGWEARVDGARHLRQRTWNVQGQSGGNDPRNGFHRIEILELRPGTQDPVNSGRSEPVRNLEPIGVQGSSQPSSRPIMNSEAES